MKEIVILSGKGGTGKTSLTAAFSTLIDKPVIVDCDVDAANLHLLLSHTIERRRRFVAGAKALVDAEICNGCGNCIDKCRFDAIHLDGIAKVDPLHCEGCGVCALNCTLDAISLLPQDCGEWFLSRTRNGAMLHARLSPGQENSGKLVSTLRQLARELADENGSSWILVDGPPGSGCPVISSLTGADYAVMVTEPSLSAFNDLQRAVEVADHFRIPAGIIVNKADINFSVAARIENYAETTGRDRLGQIPYDPAFTSSQLSGFSVLQGTNGSLRAHLERIWRAIERAAGRQSAPFAVLR